MQTEKRDTVSPLEELQNAASNYADELIDSRAIKDYHKTWMEEVFKYVVKSEAAKEYWLSMQAGRKTKVVCFCGSTRFAETFMVERWLLEKQGIITFGINILPNNYFVEGNSHGAEQEGVKEILDELHKRKIDLSDEVVILNIGGYIGESTRAELEYALQIGKPVKYFEPIK